MSLLKVYQTNFSPLRIMIIIFLILIFFFLSNCASTQNYFINRGNDLKDIVNIGIEKDMYGFNIITFGYQKESSGMGFGLRYGYLGIYKTGDNKNKVYLDDRADINPKIAEIQVYPGDTDFSTSVFYHEPKDLSDIRARKKQMLLFFPVFRLCKVSTSAFYKDKKLKRGISKCYFYESSFEQPLELSIGLYIGIRAGFNISEFLDFLAGIAGYDLLDDDTSSTTYNELPQALPEKPNWEYKFDSVDKKVDARFNKGK